MERAAKRRWPVAPRVVSGLLVMSRSERTNETGVVSMVADAKPIRFLFLPEGEDPDTYVRKHGPEEFRRRVREAETLSQFLLAQLRSEGELASPEGRARFVSMAKPHVQKITAPALR